MTIFRLRPALQLVKGTYSYEISGFSGSVLRRNIAIFEASTQIPVPRSSFQGISSLSSAVTERLGNHSPRERKLEQEIPLPRTPSVFGVGNTIGRNEKRGAAQNFSLLTTSRDKGAARRNRPTRERRDSTKNVSS